MSKYRKAKRIVKKIKRLQLFIDPESYSSIYFHDNLGNYLNLTIDEIGEGTYIMVKKPENSYSCYEYIALFKVFTTQIDIDKLNEVYSMLKNSKECSGRTKINIEDCEITPNSNSINL